MRNRFLAALSLLFCCHLLGLEPSVLPLPAPPPAQGFFSQSEIPECALTSKWIVVHGLFADPVTRLNRRACFVYDAATLSFKRRIPLDSFPSDLALEGDLLAVGIISDNASRGAVFVFNVLTGALIQKLTAPDGQADDRLGTQVAISGNRVVAGAPGDDDRGSSAGAAYLFDLPSGGEGEKVVAGDGQAGDLFGNALAVSGDLAVVGARGDDDRGNNAGAAYVFSLRVDKPVIGNVGPAFTQLGKITASDGAAERHFGRAVGISGRLIAVGSASDVIGTSTILTPAVYVFDAVTRAQLRTISAGSRTGSKLAINDGLVLAGQSQDGLSGGEVFIMDANTGRVVRGLSPALNLGSTDFGFNLQLAGETGIISDLGQVVIIRGLSRQLPVATVAKIGDVAPQVSPRAYKTIEAYHVQAATGSPSRVLLLQGQLTGPSGRTALWAGSTPTIAAITNEARLGTLVPLKLSQAIAQHLFLVYQAQHAGAPFTSLNDSAIVVHPMVTSALEPGLPNALYREGTVLALSTMNGRFIKGFGQLAASASDRFGFTATLRSAGGPGSTVVTAANDSGAFVSSTTSNVPTAVLLEGETSPLSGIRFGQVASRIGMQTTSAVVSTGLTGDPAANAALFQLPSTVIARKGQTAPGAVPANSTFSSFVGESTRRATLFRATLKGTTAAQNEGLWMRIAGAPFLVVQKGVDVPGLAAGLKIARFLRYSSITDTRVWIHATLSGPGVNSANDGVILLGIRSVSPEPIFEFRIVLREGQTAADTGGHNIGAILQFEVTEADSADAAVITSLTGAPANANLALWSLRPSNDGRAVRQRLRKGNYQGGAGSTALLTSLKMTIPAEPSGAATKGLGSPVGEGRIALVLTFSNRQVIAGPLKDPDGEPTP